MILYLSALKTKMAHIPFRYSSESMSRRIAMLKRLAGLQGNDKARSNACFRLAAAFGTGDGVKKDGKEEVKWLIKASELGHVESQNKLGNCYYNGKGVAQSYEKAFEWYQKAADQGRAGAQYNLGACYYNGAGVTVDRKKAKRSIKLAAKQGNAAAHSMLAHLEAESGKDSNLQKAQKHIRKAQAALQADDSVQSARYKHIAQVIRV